MWQQCRHFLNEQLEAIAPLLVVTLGRESFELLHFVDGEYDSLLCQLFEVGKGTLLTPQPFKGILHSASPKRPKTAGMSSPGKLLQRMANSI